MTTAIILAGGRASRMGGVNKALMPYQGKPLLEHVLIRVQSQVDHIVINANSEADAFAAYGFPVVPDKDTSLRGPLLGLYSVLLQCSDSHYVTLPCDMPALPVDTVERLQAASHEPNSLITLAHDGQRLQPLVNFMRAEMKEAIGRCLQNNRPRVDRCFLECPHAIARFNDPGAFVNINAWDELHNLQQRDCKR